jgi:hypothetical protein
LAKSLDTPSEKLGGERLPVLDAGRLLTSFPRREVCGAETR